MSHIPRILRLKPRIRGMMKARLDHNKTEKWRLKKFKDQNGLCCYCGIAMALEPPFTKKRPRASLEHLTPMSRGGLHHWENVVVSCEPCNHEKGDRTDAEFRAARLSVEET